jgi:rSAM/selenodomain-associated transferase 1
MAMLAHTNDQRRLLLFVRLPEKGRVKTRLARTIGEEAACDLYQCLVADSLSLARRSGYPTTVFYFPKTASPEVSLGLAAEIPCLPQTGRDLGERMYTAFRTAFRDAGKAILMGSDIPDLPPSFLDEAFESLRGDDAVIGPALDGGYYLIGFSSGALLSSPFSGMEWGGPSVFQKTLRIIRDHRLRVHVLPEWRDVDEYEDLSALFDRQKALPDGTLTTIDFLRHRFHW